MARPRSTTLTEGEQRIMEVLWRLGEASVQQVTDELAKSEPIAYTTALTMLRILTDKNYVDYRKEGKAHVYVPTVTRDSARSSALRQLLKRFFDDSPQVLAQHLMRETDLDPQDLDRLAAQVNKAKVRTKNRRTPR
jgi:BlaI family transcriptional regulator, penicillinase repressor